MSNSENIIQEINKIADKAVISFLKYCRENFAQHSLGAQIMIHQKLSSLNLAYILRAIEGQYTGKKFSEEELIEISIKMVLHEAFEMLDTLRKEIPIERTENDEFKNEHKIQITLGDNPEVDELIKRILKKITN